MFPDNRCELCPLTKRGDTGACLAQSTKNERYCFHAKNGHEGYINIILGDSKKIEESITIVKEHNPSSLGSQTGPAGHMIPINQNHEANRKELERIRSCKHLKICGCGGGRLGDCDLGLGDGGKVKVTDCQGCEKWSAV